MATTQQALFHLLARIKRDPVLAYYFDQFTESMSLLTAAYAEAAGLDLEEFRKEYYTGLTFEKPVCMECKKNLDGMED